MLRMTVEGVAYDHTRQIVVVLKDWEGKNLLPIWIGQAEAKAIAIELEGARPGRPLSHDLLLNVVATARGRVTRVVINDLVDGTYLATIDIDTPLGTRHIDSRPSDALAVAVRARCPVFVDGGALRGLVDSSKVGNLQEMTGDPSSESLEGDSGEIPELLGSAPDSSTPGGGDSPPENDEELQRFRRLLGEE